ncbi:unnamed protein product [Urochloa humidicola]
MDAWEDGGAAESFSSSTGGAPTAEIFEEQAAGLEAEDEEGEGEEKVFVAVPGQPKSGRSLLAWALRHVAAVAGAAVVVAHVHVPAQMIPMTRKVGTRNAAPPSSPSPAAEKLGAGGSRRPASTFGISMCRRRGPTTCQLGLY